MSGPQRRRLQTSRALTVSYQGDLVGEEGAADPGLARRVIENFLEDWKPGRNL